MDYIPDTNIEVLQHLATYKFLTVKQFIMLGLAKHKESVHRILSRFERSRKKLVDKKDLGAIPGQGRLPIVYYLTRRGAEALAEFHRTDISEIPYPKSVNFFKKDFEHRQRTVDFHIALRKWVSLNNASIHFADCYFDSTGNNRTGGKANALKAKTRVELSNGFIIPDMIYSVVLENGKPCLSALEIHNGRDTGRFIRQMERHIQSLKEGSVTDHYHMNVACFVLGIFEHESIRNASLNHLQQREDWNLFQKFIGLETLDNLNQFITNGTNQFRFVASG